MSKLVQGITLGGKSMQNGNLLKLKSKQRYNTIAVGTIWSPTVISIGVEFCFVRGAQTSE